MHWFKQQAFDLATRLRVGWQEGVASALIGLVLAVAISHQLGVWAFAANEALLVYTFLAILCAVTAYELLVLTAWRRLDSFSNRARIAWIPLSILAGLFLFVVIPIRIGSIPIQHRLEIVATGQKNPLSGGTDLWILRLYRSDGSQIPNSNLVLIGDWRVVDTVPISSDHQPSVARWEGSLQGDLTLILESHPFSGVATIRWDDAEQTVDLYSTERNGSKSFNLPAYPLGGFEWFGRGIKATTILGLGAFFFFLSVMLATRAHPDEISEPSRWTWVYYAFPCALVWILYLLAFYPASMSLDSVDQWYQLLTGSYSDAHPAIHTMTMWLLTRLWNSPAFIALVQIVALSAVAGWGLALVRRFGVPRWLVWTACLIFAFVPINGAWVVTIWKDIAYSTAFLALTFLVVLIVATDGAWLERHRSWIGLGVIAVLVALYRHNGITAAFATPILLALIYRKQSRWLVASLALMGVIWLGVKEPLYTWAQVRTLDNRDNQWFSVYALSQGVTAHLEARTQLTSDEKSFVEGLLPVGPDGVGKCSNFNCLNSPFSNWGPIFQNRYQFLWLMVSLSARNPSVTLDLIVRGRSVVWEIIPPHETYLYGTPVRIGEHGEVVYIFADPNPVNATQKSKLPDLAQRLAQIIQASQKGLWTIWRPATYLHLLLAGTAIAAVRARKWRVLLIALPAVIHSLTLILIAPVTDARYMYGVMLVPLVLWPGLFFGRFPELPREPS